MVGAIPQPVKKESYVYHCRCRSCGHEERSISSTLGGAEKVARAHAIENDHTVDVSFDMLGVHARTFTGGRE